MVLWYNSTNLKFLKKLYKSDNNTMLITLNGAVCKSKNLNCVFPMLKGTVQCLARNPKRGKE